MHIVGILAALAVTVGVILWRLNNAAQATKGIAEAADDLHGLWRKWKWRRKLAPDALALVDDPRIAAAAMMVATAEADGAMSDAERQVIIAEAKATLGCPSDRVAEELFVQARFAVKDSHDLANVLRRLMPVILEKCGPAEKADLVRMLDKVAAADGTVGEAEQLALARMKRELTR